MKKIILSIITLLLLAGVYGQNGNYKKGSQLGLSFFLNDFKTGNDIRNNGLSSVIRKNNLFKLNRMNAGMGVNYLKGLSSHVDFAAFLGGSFVDYPIPNMPPVANNKFLLELNTGVNVKLLSDKYWFVPFAHVGMGFSKYLTNYAAYIPAGLGIQLKLAPEAFILINSQYRMAITERAAFHLFHSVGITGAIGRPKTEPVKEVVIPVVPPADRDGDGILDNVDECPDQAGPASLNGCPDRDGDGIADKNDDCPDVAGLAKYRGCPIPDTDKDGINDEQDKCPTVPGVARYQGCPVPDTDRDGVNDEEDKCPNEAGPASNFGCPVIQMEIIEKVNVAARNIFFATGSSKLLAKSFPSLNSVVKILQDNPSYKVDIAGHTDYTGTTEKNHVLSHDRANSVKAFLVSKGIDESRMTSEGFGEDVPIADNKTVAGRAKNRRVEMKLRNY